MNIQDLIARDHVVAGMKVANKERAIRDLAARAAAALGLDAGAVTDELLRREELGSTGIGEGVAIPHARLNGLARPFGVLARLKRPIDFDSVDGQPVDLIFLLLMPSAENSAHLYALACVARTLRDTGRLQHLRQAEDAEQLYRALI